MPRFVQDRPQTNRRLLHLTWDSPDNPWCGGGGAFRDYQILSMLDRWEREVCSGKHPKRTAAPTGTLRIVKGIGLFGEFVSRRTWARAASRYLEERLRADPTLVVSQSASAWAPVWKSLEHPRRILHTVHHVAGASILERLGPWGPSSLRYEQRILAEGEFYATPNRATAARILAANPDARVEIIPNGYTPPTKTVAPENRFPGSVRIAFLGRLDHQMKGLDRLLAAFSLVGERLPEARLLLAGRSDICCQAWLSRALHHHPLRDRIEVVHNPSEERKYALLDGSDIFCVPSRFEGWCIAAIEAQSRGLPVVATRTDGLLDSVVDGRTGILVSNEESQAVGELAEGILALAQDADKRRELGAAAATWACRFSWDAATAATESLLEEIRTGL